MANIHFASAVPHAKCYNTIVSSYGTVFMENPFLVHMFYLMNADPQTRPTYLDCESVCRLLPSTFAIAIYYYYSAQKLILLTAVMYADVESIQQRDGRWRQLATKWFLRSSQH